MSEHEKDLSPKDLQIRFAWEQKKAEEAKRRAQRAANAAKYQENPPVVPKNPGEVDTRNNRDSTVARFLAEQPPQELLVEAAKPETPIVEERVETFTLKREKDSLGLTVCVGNETWFIPFNDHQGKNFSNFTEEFLTMLQQHGYVTFEELEQIFVKVYLKGEANVKSKDKRPIRQKILSTVDNLNRKLERIKLESRVLRISNEKGDKYVEGFYLTIASH